MTTPPPLPAPPRSPQLTVGFEESGWGVRLQRSPREWGVGCFLSFWLAGWTVGCIFLLVMVIRQGEPFFLLFGLPFWAAWFAAVYFLLNALFYREEFSLDDKGAHLRKSIIFTTFQRDIPPEELLRFETSWQAGTSGRGGPVSQIDLVTTGQPISFFSGVPEGERQWLTWRLNDELRRLHPQRGHRPANQPRQFADLAERPSDCNWRLEEHARGLCFYQRGQLTLTALGGVLFINLFWNGIVGVFVGVLWGFAPGGGGPAKFSWEWWGMFLFLIPFELIGLLLIAGLLLTLLEPFRRTRWSFGPDEIVYRQSWLGIGWNWRYDPLEVGGVEVRIEDPGEGSGLGPPNPAANPQQVRQVKLILFDRDEDEMTAVSGVTLGEARWMQQILLREFPNWKSRMRRTAGDSSRIDDLDDVSQA